MNASRFDAIARRLAGRRSRRQVVRDTGAAALAATGLASDIGSAAAQNATPVPAAGEASDGPSLLFVQVFEGGAITSKDGSYALTLQHASGQTIYFADHPDRQVGTYPTTDFLALPLFTAANPPNAALVVELEPGVTDIAVVELLDPVYDTDAGTVTYEIVELADYTESQTVGLTVNLTDLATLLPEFGSAHLFIDSQPGDLPCSPEHSTIYCYRGDTQVGPIGVGTFYWRPCGDSPVLGCRPYGGCSNDACNERYPECEGECWSHSPEIQDCDYCRV